MGILLNMTFLSLDKKHIMTNALKIINICIYMVWDNGNGTFENVSEEQGHFILWETGHSTPWERFFTLGIGTPYPLGIGPLILWDSGHPLGNGTRYPLGFGPLILWETSSGNREFGNRFLTVCICRINYLLLYIGKDDETISLNTFH